MIQVQELYDVIDRINVVCVRRHQNTFLPIVIYDVTHTTFILSIVSHSSCP